MADANARIEELRKSQVEFNFLNVEATELSLEVEQLSHSFPFGQAVVSNNIAACHSAGEDDNYCSYVSNNFNWLVDTYRSELTLSSVDIQFCLQDEMESHGASPGRLSCGHS